MKLTVFCSQTLIRKPYIFITDGIDFGECFSLDDFTAVFEHGFHDAAGALAMMIDFRQIVFEIIYHDHGVLDISFVDFFLLLHRGSRC